LPLTGLISALLLLPPLRVIVLPLVKVNVRVMKESFSIRGKAPLPKSKRVKLFPVVMRLWLGPSGFVFLHEAAVEIGAGIIQSNVSARATPTKASARQKPPVPHASFALIRKSRPAL
jgi:hypothetical protein